MRRAVVVPLAGACLVVASLHPLMAAPVTVPHSTFVTLQFGRTQWVSTFKCVPIDGAIDLGSVAAELQRRGYTGVGAVVLNRTSDGFRQCINSYYLSASWQDVAALQGMGWSFISGSQSYTNITKLTPPEQQAESCGTLPDFATRGIDASGEFAYADNKSSHAVQSQIVSACFDWGRKYQSYSATSYASIGPPWFQSTHSLSGGLCNNIVAPCYSSGAKTRYQMPSKVARWLAGLNDRQWATLQAYRFVTGVRNGTPSWDCTSPDPRNHWTSQGEYYCWVDYLAILDSIPRSFIVTDPATVAAAWGRTLNGG
jgi:hypothetical protein